jgi:hypothetical protein
MKCGLSLLILPVDCRGRVFDYGGDKNKFKLISI